MDPYLPVFQKVLNWTDIVYCITYLYLKKYQYSYLYLITDFLRQTLNNQRLYAVPIPACTFIDSWAIG